LIPNTPIYGDPVLTDKAQEVGRNVPLRDLLNDMRAAQQQLAQPCIAGKHVGVNVRVLLVSTSFDRNRLSAETISVVLVNPEVVALHNPLVAGLESDPCIPHYQGSVERHSAVQVKYLDENFVQQQETFTDAAARWVLHGIELLDGKLFIDNLNEHRKRSIKGHLKRIAEKGAAKMENGNT